MKEIQVKTTLRYQFQQLINKDKKICRIMGNAWRIFTYTPDRTVNGYFICGTISNIYPNEKSYTS